MADDQKPEMVTMEALQWHTYNGQAYAIGETYELPADLVDSLTAQGKAVRADRVEHAKRQADAAEETRQAQSQPVSPMTTHDIPGTTPEVK